jgi:hypothetical protein
MGRQAAAEISSKTFKEGAAKVNICAQQFYK